jgi:hypothetical protein
MRVSPAVRVAATATAVVAVCYIICVIVLNVVVSGHLTNQNDERLAARLAIARRDPDALSARVARVGLSPASEDDDVDGDSAPVFLWSVNDGGAITGHSPNAPALPATVLAGDTLREGFAKTAVLGSTGAFRLKMTRAGDGWLMAGQSLVGEAHTQRLLLTGEIVAGPFLLLAMFGGSLVVGLRSLAPVEQSRRRQLEFTADASHELRTPLSVIRAEADLALSSPREAAEYRDALTRIHGESQRLRQLVEDMLWLARFDSDPPPPGNEPVDHGHHRRGGADQRPAGVDRPAGRRSGGQRLPVRGPGRAGPDRGRGSGQPGQPRRGGQRSRHSRGRTAAPVRPVPPRHRDRHRDRSGARTGHRRFDRALDRRTLAGRRLPAGRCPDVGVVASFPAAPRPAHDGQQRLGGGPMELPSDVDRQLAEFTAFIDARAPGKG